MLGTQFAGNGSLKERADPGVACTSALTRISSTHGPAQIERALDRPAPSFFARLLLPHLLLLHEAASCSSPLSLSLCLEAHPSAQHPTAPLWSIVYLSPDPARGPHRPCSSARCCRSPRQPLHASTRTRRHALQDARPPPAYTLAPVLLPFASTCALSTALSPPRPR
ncbi:hypothetical protein ACJQWK_11680 [Exserohilum turcicum]